MVGRKAHEVSVNKRKKELGKQELHPVLLDQRGKFAKGNPGRKPGVPNRKVQEVREIASRVLFGKNPEIYIENLRERIMKGTAPHMETFLAQHLWGRPTENLHVTLTEVHLMAVRGLSDLELSAFLEAMERKQPDEALRLLPGSVA